MIVINKVRSCMGEIDRAQGGKKIDVGFVRKKEH